MILADWILPDGKGIDILPRKDWIVTCPLVIMTGFGDERLAVEIMKSGAIDYVVKSGNVFEQLPAISKRALREWENIEKRRLAEDAAKDSQKRLADILNFLPDAVLAIDSTGHVIAWNRACEEMTGTPTSEMLGRGNYEYSIPFYGERRPILIDLVLNEDPDLKKRYSSFRNEGEKIIGDTYTPTLYGGKGAYLWGSASPLFDSAGNRTGAIEVIRDISEHKQNEDLLIRSKGTLKTLLNAPKDTIALLDRQGKIIDINEEGARRLGSTIEKALGRCAYDLLPEGLARVRREKIEEVFATGNPAQFDDERNGMFLHNEVYPIFRQDRAGVDQVAIFARDITEQKKAELALEISEDRFRHISSLTTDFAYSCKRPPGGVFTIDWISGAVRAITGFSDDEIRSMGCWRGIVASEDLGIFDEKIAGLKPGQSSRCELRIRAKDGRIKWLVCFAECVNDPAYPGFHDLYGGCQDISEQKRIEQALHVSEQKFRTVADYTYDWEYWINPDGTYTYISPACERITGYSPEEFYQDPELLLRIVHPGDKQKVQKHTESSNAGEEIKKSFEFRIITKSGETAWIGHICRPLFNDKGEFMGRRGSNRDITKRKQAETALVESETRFRALVQNSSDIIRILDPGGLIIYESSSAERILGYPPGSMIGKNPLDLIHPEDIGRVKAALGEVFDRTNPGVPTEFRIRKANGEYLWVDSVGTNLLNVHGVNGIVITTRPIQQRKEAEERILAAKRLYEVLSRINQAIVRVKDLDTLIDEVCRISVSAGGFRMSWIGLLDQESGILRPVAHAGYELGYLGLFEFGRRDDEKGRGPIGTALRKGQPDICNDIATDPRMLPWRDEAMKRGFYSSAVFPFRYHGEIAGAYMIYASVKNFFNNSEIELLNEISMNISFALDRFDDQARRTQAEHALSESEERLRLAMEGADVALWDWDLVTGKVVFSDKFYTMLDYEPGDFPQDYEHWIQLIHPEDKKKVLPDFESQIRSRKPVCEIEYRAKTKSGDWYWVLGRGKIAKTDEQGNPVRITGVNIDITNRKLMESEVRSLNTVLEQRVKDRTNDLTRINEALEEENAQRLTAESKLRASLEEKTVLLKEIHHRVKNNLQIIASLLNLQSRYIHDDATLAAIRESQNRVRAMALVHEKLYRSEDLARIDLNDYIKFLGTGLFQFYDARVRGIQFSLDIRNISVSINVAIPLGLIINELLSNSLKYAYPDGRQGVIAISVSKLGHAISILYSDDGIGISADLDWRNTESLGLRLVNTLVDQLNGSIELDRTSGTRFIMNIQEKEEKA